MTKTRDVSLDIAKGIGIILIVLSHVRANTSSQVLLDVISFVFYFHVTLFFIISGYFTSPKRGWKEYLSKKFKQLALPYLVANVVFFIIDFCIHAFLIRDNQIDFSPSNIIRIITGIEPVYLGVATWFLMSLFWVSVAYKIIFHLCRQNSDLSLIVSFVIAIAGYFVQIKCSFFGVVFIARTCIILSLYAAGFSIREHKILDWFNKNQTRAVLTFIASLAFLLIVFFGIRYRVNYFWTKGDNLPLFYLTGFSGSLMVISLSKILSSKLSGKSFLSYCGSGSLWILIGHHLVFIVINLILIRLDSLSDYSALKEICYSTCHGRWIIYLIGGVVAPLVAKMMYKRFCSSKTV